MKDVLQAAEAAGSFEADVVARDLMRELVTVPENRLIEDVLAKFQRRRIQMAVVIDEWGSFEGLITLEDILEEIVGEIRDEATGRESGRLMSQPTSPTVPAGFPHRQEVRS